MAEMRPPLSPTSNNAKRASETAASQPWKKQRLGDTPLPSGAADQEPPPKDVAPREKPEKNDVEMTRGDARPMELVVEEGKPVGAEDEAEEEAQVDADEARAARGWLSNGDTVDAKVAEAVAALAKDNAPKKKHIEDTLEALPALEALVGNGLTKTECRDFCTKWNLPQQSGAIGKIPEKLRTKLEKKQKEMVVQQKLDGERAVLETTLHLEHAAFDALPDSDKKGVVGQRSLLVLALLMAGASSDCLKKGKDQISGNVNHLVIALREAGVELANGGTNEATVLRAVSSLEAKIAELPPEIVASAVVERTRLAKHAARTNGAACAALATTIRDAATGFAAQGAASAAKMSVTLPDFPIIDDATLERRTAQNVKWSNAPPADLANVRLGTRYDSHVLGATAPPKDWPKWRGRPTIVADPLTKIEGVELTTIKPMGALAKKLLHGEKSEKGKPAGYAA
ncbi:unnamed protein product [Pelagomonas calceolata]|uniref:Uncharacterized protein n=1 Tax=Pelagomonas calceolata TaxID=35677 RepID=A0A7S4A6Z1_9STRA|nr:unnamed protein product [Pelagomonas calceolata]|mmetsp:Transcript_18886/g.53833  ORF Transcript_18886/g.53833 Transcript_18886/m.53833 type:complete len:456 (-) Transcript_18886:53-1420(-)